MIVDANWISSDLGRHRLDCLYCGTVAIVDAVELCDCDEYEYEVQCPKCGEIFIVK